MRPIFTLLNCPNKIFIRSTILEKVFHMTQKELSTYDFVIKVQERRISQLKAAELLKISDRHFRRLLKAYREEGPQGLVHKNRGRPSNHRLPEKLYQKTIALIREKYSDFGPTLAREKLIENHRINVSVETLRKWMIRAGIWDEKRRKKLKVHQSRLRRSYEGELIQVDGSPHDWFEERGPRCCLLGFIDDATSKIKHLKFVPSESTESYFRGMSEYVIKHGKPRCFYTDRLTVFKVNQDKEDYRKSGLTQVGRALKELEVELICVNSPQAKGRIERLFKTLQDRLVNEMRLKKISTMEEGNVYIDEYIERYNAQFSIEAREKEDLHEKTTEERVRRAFRYKEERVLSKNLEISYRNRILQIKTENAGYRMRGARVKVIEDLEGELEIAYEGKKLDYKELLVKDTQGRILSKKEVAGHVFPPRGKGRELDVS